MYNIPILFIVFNRIEPTKQVFAKIKEVAPKQLFIAMDGPRKNIQGEAEKCENVRNWVLSQIDWDCELHCVCSANQMLRKKLFYFRFGVIPQMWAIPDDSFHSDIGEVFESIPDVLLHDADWQKHTSRHFIRTRQERMPGWQDE